MIMTSFFISQIIMIIIHTVKFLIVIINLYTENDKNWYWYLIETLPSTNVNTECRLFLKDVPLQDVSTLNIVLLYSF